MDAKLAQPGFDVETAGDQNLIFSDQFPVLKEEKSGLFKGGFNNYEHNLGYEPFYLIFDTTGRFLLGSGGVDAKKIYGPTDGGTYRFHVYRLKLFENYDAPALNVQFATEGGAGDKFALKIAKKNKAVDSSDLRDYAIHSRARSPLIHKVNYQDWLPTAALGNHTVAPGLPYNPIAFGFAKNTTTGVTTNLISGGQSPPKLSRNGATGEININNAGTNASRTSIVIFKDPILAPLKIKVAI